MSDDQWKSSAKQVAQPHMSQLLADLESVTGAVLAGSDGFEIAAVGDASLGQARLASMSSSMQSLGEAMASTSGLDHCRDIIIEGDAGRIVLMSVPDTSPHLVLMTIVTGQSAFGHLLLQCRRCCVAIGKDLGSRDLVPASANHAVPELGRQEA